VKIKISWENGITTAAVNEHGDVMLANVADDAVVTEALVWKYAGFVLHELLHRKWSDFAVIRSAGGDFLRQLHNGVEDAWIENRAVRERLTGNVEQLLAGLVNVLGLVGWIAILPRIQPVDWDAGVAKA
jgi:hypothetical protein